MKGDVVAWMVVDEYGRTVWERLSMAQSVANSDDAHIFELIEGDEVKD